MKFFEETGCERLLYLEALRFFELFAFPRLSCPFEEQGEQEKKEFSLGKICPCFGLESGLSVL